MDVRVASRRTSARPASEVLQAAGVTKVAEHSHVKYRDAELKRGSRLILSGRPERFACVCKNASGLPWFELGSSGFQPVSGESCS